MRIGGVNNMKKYKIAVAGTGYVGLSIATLLSQHHHETAVDIIPEKVEMINNRKSPIQDDYIEKYLAEKELNLTVSTIARTTIAGAIINVLVNLALIRFIGLYAASISTLVSYASTALYRRIDIRKYIKIKVNVKNILLNSVAVVFVTLSYYFNITILNVAALVIACIYAVGINWKLIKMFFAEIRKYKKEGN